MSHIDQASRDKRDGDGVGHAPVTAQLTRDDYAKVSGLIFAHAMGPWRFAVGVAPVGFAALAMLIGLMIGHGLAMGETGRLALACAFGLMAAQGANALVQRLTRGKHLAAQGGFLRPFVIEADADGLTARSEAAATRLVWDGVLDIVMGDDFILVYTDATSALAIPKSAFPDAIRMNAFCEQLASHWQAAKARTHGQGGPR
ncbi:MAG: YcxB family protein [Caulobacterales bacterium]|jgi:hypothetical protein